MSTPSARSVSLADAPRPPEEVSAAMHLKDRVAQELAMSIDHADVGAASVSMTVQTSMCNGLGVCHGGIVFTLADTAMAHASNAGDERSFSTTATIEWLRSAGVGDRLTAVSTVVDRRGRNTIHDVEVVDQTGRRIAMVRGHTLTVGGPVAR